MGGKIIGVRLTIMEQSVQVAPKQFIHVTRMFRHSLHSTKGWKKAGTQKKMEPLSRPRNTGLKTHVEYRRI